jgi:transmembrane sensor
MLMLDDGVSPAQRDACTAGAAAPEHERAWQKAQRVQAQLGLLPHRLAMGTLDRERRQVLRQLLALAIVAPLGYLGYRQLAPQAAYATQVGQHQQLTLADGTVLDLNTDTRVDVDFDDDQRLITLRAGEILVDSGPDANSWPPAIARCQRARPDGGPGHSLRGPPTRRLHAIERTPGPGAGDAG